MRTPLAHKLFRIGVAIKGVIGCLQILTGISLLLAPTFFSDTLKSLFAKELLEDPSDVLANLITNLSFDTIMFISLYFVAHGVLKLFFTYGLWHEEEKIFLPAIGFLGVIILFQAYKFFLTHSLWLVTLIIFDIIITYFIWIEYQNIKKKSTPTRD